jgi:hypothetical protein
VEGVSGRHGNGVAEDTEIAGTNPEREGAMKKQKHESRLAWKFLPEEFKPRLEYNTRNEMTFPDFRSSITVGTGRVQKKMSGAKLGRTYQELLITEAADPAWEDDVIKMLLQTVPDDGIVYMESTP